MFIQATNSLLYICVCESKLVKTSSKQNISQ